MIHEVPDASSDEPTIDVMQYRPLALASVRRLHVSARQHEDALQGAMLGLVEAAGQFDSARGVPFGAYARGFVLHGVRQATGRTRKRVAEVQWPDDEEYLVRVDHDHCDRVVLCDEHRAVRDFVGSLTGLDADLYHGLFVEQKSQNRLAAELGMTPMQLTRAKQAFLARAHSRLRPVIELVA